MKIAITAPIFVKNAMHLQYLHEMTMSIYTTIPYVFLPVENFVSSDIVPLSYTFQSISMPSDNVILKREEPQSVAKAWNTGIAKAGELGCDYVLVVNTDVVFKKSAIDNLVQFAVNNPDFMLYTMSEWTDHATLPTAPEHDSFAPYPHFSAFMVRPSILKTVGEFDENFIPAYLEDNDYAYRIVLNGGKTACCESSRFYHYGSRTIKEDSELWVKNTQTFPRNQQYFLEKWGYSVVSEPDEMLARYYKTPFNK